MTTNKSSKKTLIQEFKEFINRGSVIDLAVGMIIGTAFSKIVSSLVSNIFMPVVSLIVGGVDFTSLSIDIPNFFGGNSTAHIRYGSFLQSIVDFLAIALCVFLFVKFMNKLNEKAARLAKRQAAAEEKAEEAEKTAERATSAEEIALLTEIRDALVDKPTKAKTAKTAKKSPKK